MFNFSTLIGVTVSTVYEIQNLKAYGDDPMLTNDSNVIFLLDGDRAEVNHKRSYMQIQSTDTKNNNDEQTA
jgi:hypothetical protein